MDIKQYKKDLETKVTNSIKSLVSEDVVVNTAYDMEKDIISTFLMEEHVKEGQTEEEKIRESLVVYNCVYNKETSALTVIGFVRRYIFDGFGIANVVNDPVAVDEAFMNGIKGAIFAALQPEMEQPEQAA